MHKPSPQFIGKLESELRLAYRAQYRNAAAPRPLGKVFAFLVPAFSGLLVIAILLVNNGSNTNSSNIQDGGADINEESLVTFNEGAEEEAVAQGFDNEELNRIDSGVQLIAQANY